MIKDTQNSGESGNQNSNTSEDKEKIEQLEKRIAELEAELENSTQYENLITVLACNAKYSMSYHVSIGLSSWVAPRKGAIVCYLLDNNGTGNSGGTRYLRKNGTNINFSTSIGLVGGTDYSYGRLCFCSISVEEGDVIEAFVEPYNNGRGYAEAVGCFVAFIG